MRDYIRFCLLWDTDYNSFIVLSDNIFARMPSELCAWDLLRSYRHSWSDIYSTGSKRWSKSGNNSRSDNIRSIFWRQMFACVLKCQSCCGCYENRCADKCKIHAEDVHTAVHTDAGDIHNHICQKPENHICIHLPLQ